MKRLTISLVVVAMMLLASPAIAKKPIKPDPEPPPPVACAFNTDGVLVNTDGQAVTLGTTNTSYRCELTAAHAIAYTFTIADPSGTTASLLNPYVAIRDQYPVGGNICFRDTVIGRVTNPGDGVFAEFSTPAGGIDTFDEPDGTCGENDTDESETYAFTFQTGKAKGGTVQLTMTPQP